MIESSIDPDKALVALGKYGKYQLQIWIAANLPSLYMALQMLSMAFVNGKPDFYCSSGNETTSSHVYNWTMRPNDTCFFTPSNQTVGPTSLPCGSEGSKLVYDGDYGTTIVTEWDLVCQKNFYSEFVGSIFMLGVMVGAVSITQISDKLGRRWTFLICNWLYGIVGLGLAFTNSYVTFAFTRFLAGVLSSGIGMVGFVLSCESIPASWRATSTLLGCVMWVLGYVALGVIAMFVRDWRRLSIFVALPSFISLVYYWFVPETLRWLIVNGKEEEAKKWIAKAAKCNRVTVNIEELRKTEKDGASSQKIKSRNLFDIFTSKVLALQTLVMCYLWLCNAFVYYGLSLFSTRLSGDRYLNFILSGLVELPAYFTAIVTLEKFGRRATTIIFHIVAGVALFVLIFIPNETASGVNLLPLITTLSLVGKFAISCTFQAIFLFAAELYPTTVRTVGCGLSSTAARIGAILAPYVALLADINPAFPPAICGIMSLVAAVLASCLPETKGVELCNDIDEVQPGPFQRLIFRHRKTVDRKMLTEKNPKQFESEALTGSASP